MKDFIIFINLLRTYYSTPFPTMMMPCDTILISFNDIHVDAKNLLDSRMEQLVTYFEKHWLFNIDTRNVPTIGSRTDNTFEGKMDTDFILIIIVAFCRRTTS